MSKQTYQVAVIGAGPAGLATALLMARSGAKTLLADRPAPKGIEDHRTSALMQASVNLLKAIDIWQEIEPQAAPLWVMRLIDDTGRLLKARPIDFDARELGAEPFGWNIPNTVLVGALKAQCAKLKNLTFLQTNGLEQFALKASEVNLHFDGGITASAQIVIGADGRNSRVRQDAGIKTNRWNYDQTALVTSFTHDKPHNDVSTEFHRPAGPLTLVPLGPKSSSLVWMEKPRQAERLLQLDEDSFAREFNHAIHNVLGDLKEFTPRQIFPISGLTAREFAKNRAMLVGEAAHVVPPIGAQGLNLGLRDGALAAELVEQALKSNKDPGGADLLAIYDRRRRADIVPRAMAIDLLNRSLTSGFLPFQGLRSAGIFALENIGPLRRALMAQGIAPSKNLPRIMRA